MRLTIDLPRRGDRNLEIEVEFTEISPDGTTPLALLAKCLGRTEFQALTEVMYADRFVIRSLGTSHVIKSRDCNSTWDLETRFFPDDL